MRLLNKLNFALLEIAQKFEGVIVTSLTDRERQTAQILHDAGYVLVPISGPIQIRRLPQEK